MNCQEFESNAREIVREQSEVLEHAEGVAHAKRCSHCAERLREEQSLWLATRAVLDDTSDQANAAQRRGEAALLTVLRQQSVSASPAFSIGARPVIWRWGAIAAAILIVIATLSLIRIWSMSRVISQSKKAPLTIDPTPRKPEPPVVERHDRELQPATSNAHTRRRPLRPASQSIGNSEFVTDFFPLVEGVDLSTLDNARLVRVELSGSALSDVGLPMGSIGSTDRVRADVLLGYDGMARAIRFVR